MVCHETYRSEDGKWFSPVEIERVSQSEAVALDGKEPLTIGRSEKMSKSRKNVVDPENIVQTYGADTARLFMLSDSPPDRDLEWTESGVEGAWRFVNRVWRLASDPAVSDAFSENPPASFNKDALALRRIAHKTIDGVTGDIERFHFNRAVARIRELSNAISDFKGDEGDDIWAKGEAIQILIRLLAPMTPHLAEELWAGFGSESLLVDTPWPKADSELLADDTITIAVQVNGKLRGTLDLTPDMPKADVEAAALDLDPVKALLDGGEPRKVIVVPNRIVNIVV